MNERTLNLKLLVSAQLEELADRLEREGVTADTTALRSTSMLLDDI
jgi:hypothetical protein